MSTDGYLALLEELSAVDADPKAKDAFRQLVLQRINSELSEQEERVRFARHLLANGEPRPVIRERLQARYTIGRAQAYRDIDRALQTVSLK